MVSYIPQRPILTFEEGVLRKLKKATGFCSQNFTSDFVVKKSLTRDNQVGLSEETSLYFKLFTEISFALLFIFFTKEHIFFFCSNFFYGKDTIYIYIIISKTWVYHN